jgi:hypothetical protein
LKGVRDVTAVVLVFVRYGVLFGARVLGPLRRACFGSWRRPLLGLLCTWGVALLLTGPGPVDPSWLTLLNVVGLFVLVALARWAIVSRKRLVIGNFVDYSGKEPQRLPGLSLPSRSTSLRRSWPRT